MITFGRVVLFILCLWFSLVPYAQALDYLALFYLALLEPSSHDKWIAVPWLLLSCVVPAALVAAVV